MKHVFSLKFTLSFFLLLSSSVNVFAQNDTLYFRHYSVDQGLSNPNVSSIIQDSLGFMWYGTEEGLNMFDGYKFLPFKHDPSNKNSLVSDDISCLAVEKSGIIWIGTKLKGINRYNPYTGVFELFKKINNDPLSLSDDRITSLHIDNAHGILWIGTNDGLNAMNLKTKKLTRYKNNPLNSFSISDDRVTCITEDKKEIIWIGTNGGGLNSFDVVSGNFTVYKNKEKNSSSLSNNFVRCVFADKQNSIWVATADGLNSMDSTKAGFKIFKHNDKDPFSLCNNNLTSVYQDKYGKIWVGTIRDGLCVYYPKLNKFYMYSHEKEVVNSLSSNKINTISQGRSGMFWAATSDGGLNAFNPKTLYFNLFFPTPKDEENNIYEQLTAIYIDKSNNLLLGTKGKGLYVYNFSRGKLSEYKHDSKNKNSISNNNINSIFENQNGQLLIGTDEGLNELNTANGSFKLIASKNKNITSVYKGKNNILWVGTLDSGLYAYDQSTKLVKHYWKDATKLSISENNISSLLEDSSGNLWIGTGGGGLNKLNIKSENITIYKSDSKTKHPIGGNYINHLYEDAFGTIWITTNGGGLNSLAKNSHDFNCYTMHDGLPSNSMNAIMQDNNSNFWIGTDNGICRLTFKENKLQQCRIFDLIDGLPTTEFYQSSSCRNLNGRMVFTCKKGLISFHPDSLRNNPYKPPVVITGFQLFNKNIDPNDSTGILKTSISVTKELLLEHDQNSFSFEFTAISFINSGKNKYAYKLEGFDSDWNYRNAQNRMATYTNLEPGIYNFTVKASNNDGIWNDVGTSIKIIISTPYWKTTWFYLLCFLVIISIGYLIYNNRVQHLLKMQDVRNKISRDLHDHIGSSLSSISISSEVAQMMVKQKAPEAEKMLIDIGENTRTAMDNMSDIVWAINPENDKFQNVVERIQIFAAQLFDLKKIEFHFEANDEVKALKLNMQQRKNIYLILKEAINNVAKYSEAKNCFIKIEHSGKKINIEIKDDGKGFTQMAESLGGNGLINMKNRAEELNGKFSIFSKENIGTTISLQFES